MRATILAGLMVIGAAVGGEPTMAERITVIEKQLANGPALVAKHEAQAKALEARGQSGTNDRRMADQIRATMAGKQAELEVLKRQQVALADPKKAAEMAYQDAKAKVTEAEKALAVAKEQLKGAEEAYRKLGGVLPGAEPK